VSKGEECWKERSSDWDLRWLRCRRRKGGRDGPFVAQELVGLPGVVLRWVVENAKSNVDAQVSSSSSWRAGGIRWDPDIGSNRSRPSNSTSDSDEKRPPLSSSSRPEIKSDLPSALWCGPAHRGLPTTPHMHSFRFPPPLPAQYGVPSLQFPPRLP